MLASQIDRLLVDVVIGEAGRASYQLWAEVRNRGAQQLTFAMPKGFELASARRDGAAVTPGTAAGGGLSVPLLTAEAAQVDFGAGPLLIDPAIGAPRRTWGFVMTLCFSRHQYVEFVWDQTVATWLGCHRRAFEWFGAVPARLIIDNPKCAITRACRTDPLVQRAYAECAEGYGFKIDPCPPHDPQKKGIVEAGVKYVKGNFLPLREFRDLADLNAQGELRAETEYRYEQLEQVPGASDLIAKRIAADATRLGMVHARFVPVIPAQPLIAKR